MPRAQAIDYLKIDNPDSKHASHLTDCISAKEPGKATMYFLGIDVGTGGTRALVIDERGRVIASATEEHRAFTSPQIGWAEQDPRDWWRACGVAVHKALAKGRLRGDQISCVGLSGQMQWGRPAGRASARRTACADLVRRQDREAEPGLDRANRCRTPHSTHLQSRTHQFHTDQMPVGPGERTRELEQGSLPHAAQRLRAI